MWDLSESLLIMRRTAKEATTNRGRCAEDSVTLADSKAGTVFFPRASTLARDGGTFSIGIEAPKRSPAGRNLVLNPPRSGPVVAPRFTQDQYGTLPTATRF